MYILLILSCLGLLVTWLLFPLVLMLLAALSGENESKDKRLKSKSNASDAPAKLSNSVAEAIAPANVTVIISALNEAENLRKRVENLYANDYPVEKLEILIVSDGSTDNSELLVHALMQEYPGVSLLVNEQPRGRALSHNRAVKKARGDILVFTDAETEFKADFLSIIVEAFEFEKVGFASGALYYRNADEAGLQMSLGLYWKLEQRLRTWESDVGLNVFGSGACCAIRKGLYRDIPPTGDVDFTSPIDVVMQNHLCVHLPEAIAVDDMPQSRQQEFKARIRMTSKNFHGMFTRWGWRSVMDKPGYTLVILLHKYARWLTPFFMAVCLLTSFTLYLHHGSTLIGLFLLAQFCFYVVGVIGLYVPFGISTTVGSFLLANAGFAIGVLRAITGRVGSVYTPVSQTEA